LDFFLCAHYLSHRARGNPGLELRVEDHSNHPVVHTELDYPETEVAVFDLASDFEEGLRNAARRRCPGCYIFVTFTP